MYLALEVLITSTNLDTPCSREKLLEVYKLENTVVRGGYSKLLGKAGEFLMKCYNSYQGGLSISNNEADLGQNTLADIEKQCQNLIQLEKQQKAKLEKEQRANRRISISNSATSVTNTSNAASNQTGDKEIQEVITYLLDKVSNANSIYEFS